MFRSSDRPIDCRKTLKNGGEKGAEEGRGREIIPGMISVDRAERNERKKKKKEGRKEN